MNTRGLRETAVRALAKVGLVWAIAVLGAVFMTTSAQGQYEDVPALSTADAKSAAAAVTSGDAPRTAGLALALVLLGGGVVVLAVGASRGDRGDGVVEYKYDAEPDSASEPAAEPASDLSLALGLGLLA